VFRKVSFNMGKMPSIILKEETVAVLPV